MKFNSELGNFKLYDLSTCIAEFQNGYFETEDPAVIEKLKQTQQFREGRILELVEAVPQNKKKVKSL